MKSKKLTIVGGGITGLSAAFFAQRAMPEAQITVLESNGLWGGVLQTESAEGYLIEHSADMFTTDPKSAIQICEHLGKTDGLLQTIPIEDRAYVATDDTIHPVPRGLSLMLPSDLDSILATPLLSAAAKDRFQAEEQIAPSDWTQDESLISFATRRFGREVYETLIQPLVGGIYTADPEKLSMQATMARFVAMEKQHGSLIQAGRVAKEKAIQREASGARYGMFRAPKQGISELVRWIMESLPKVDFQNHSNVESVAKVTSGWQVTTVGSDSKPGQEIETERLVLATSAKISGRLLQSVDDELAKELGKIEAASSAVVILGIDRDQLGQDFSGYGIIVPSVLNRDVIATSFGSNKFEGRAPDGKVLVRCFVGGALRRELVELDDEKLIEMAIEELQRTVGFQGEPGLTRVIRWRNCMPQYHLGHRDLVDGIEGLTANHQGLELAGNSYRGVGIPACIESGAIAVERLMAE
ncbi:MAG: protoporphyrinogen oxidase [Mariniblastus sp.]|nr:protoporphyrinogen oxidase [Mariniblastus sp.]MDG2183976.1 protoporphyrinogen oxidase [Mariniblastus sp.]